MARTVTTEDVEELLEASDFQLREETSSFRRYLMDEIDWRDRLICIRGPRGAGKTTLLRQHIRDAFGLSPRNAVYATLDDLWFARHTVRDLAGWLNDHGYTHLFLDEVHHLGRDWSLAIKNVSDLYRNLHIVYTGSSMLQLEKATGDLSRRQARYELKGMSFREYLKLEGVYNGTAVPLEDVLKDHVCLASTINAKFKVLPHFEAYQERGYYPFYRESFGQFKERLVDAVNEVLEVDYPSLEDVSQDTIRKTRKMLMVLAESCPQTPVMSDLYRELDTGRDQGLKMLKALVRAGLLALVDSKGRKLDSLSKPEKIYLDNPTLMNALVPRVDAGVRRETFFCNQLRKDHQIAFTGVGDFVVDGKWTFEVGGKGKGFGQIADVPDSFVVNDNVAVGRGNKIPLWLFGFLY